MDNCDESIWRQACQLLPACRYEHEKKRMLNILKLYRQGFYEQADDLCEQTLTGES